MELLFKMNPRQIETRNEKKMTPAMACFEKGKFDMLRLLCLQYKVDMFAKDETHLSIYDNIAKADNVTLMKQIISKWLEDHKS